MKNVICCLIALSFIFAGCSKDKEPVVSVNPEETAPAPAPVEMQTPEPELFAQDTLQAFPQEDENAIDALLSDEIQPQEENKPEEQEPVVQDPVAQAVQVLNTMDDSLKRYVKQHGSCKGASPEKLDVNVSLPQYTLSINDKVCVMKAISQEEKTKGTKFSKQLGENKIYCAPGKGNLCNVAAKQGVARLKTECAVALAIGGYKIGDVFKNKGFEGKKLTQMDGKILTAYQAGEFGEDQLMLLVDASTKRIVAIRKKQAQASLPVVIRAVEKQGKITLSKRYFSGSVIGAEGKICGKYDVAVGAESGEYDWARDGGIVTINIVNKKQMDLLNKKMDEEAAQTISL